LFVAAEFAYTKLKITRVEVMVREGKASAGLIEETTQSFDAYLSGRKVGITVASLGLGALGEPTVVAGVSRG